MTRLLHGPPLRGHSGLLRPDQDQAKTACVSLTRLPRQPRRSGPVIPRGKPLPTEPVWQEGACSRAQSRARLGDMPARSPCGYVKASTFMLSTSPT